MFPLLNQRSLSKMWNTESNTMEWNRWNIYKLCWVAFNNQKWRKHYEVYNPNVKKGLLVQQNLIFRLFFLFFAQNPRVFTEYLEYPDATPLQQFCPWEQRRTFTPRVSYSFPMKLSQNLALQYEFTSISYKVRYSH